jgi:FkbM family methyltransferase
MQSKSFSKNILQGIRSRLYKISHNPYRIVNVGVFRKIYYKHIHSGKVRVHRLFGKKLSFIRSTELLHGLQEIFIDEIYKQKLPAHPFIIDCGANIGLSVIYLKRLFPDAEVLAFEPDVQNFDLLQKNVLEFGFSDVVLKNEAVWIEDKMLRFSAKGSTESRIVEDNGNSSIDVKAVRLANILQRRIDFLKIDIEGAEYDVLIDIQDKLHFVNNFFLEYHGSFNQNVELTQMLSIITNQGFKYYIREAASVYETPFFRNSDISSPFDIQLNIFCFRA